MALPATSERVANHTAAHINRQIRQQCQERVAYYREHRNEIGDRLQELNREWDIERVLETNASALVLAGLGLGFAVSRKFFVLPAVVAGFLLQHALQGWCPPVSLFRRLGVRTQTEIEAERHALRRLRERSESWH